MASSTRQNLTLYIGSGSIIWTKNGSMETSLNLYVEVRIEGSPIQSTKVIERNSAPVWNEEFTINGSRTSVISLSVNHRDDRDACVGHVNIPVGTLLDRCIDNQTAVLQLESDMPNVGNLMVKLSWPPDALSYEQEENLVLQSTFCMFQIMQFQILGDLTILDDAITNYRNIIKLIPDGHSDKPRYRADLGIALRHRYMRLGDLADVEESIFNLTNAVSFIEDEYPLKRVYLLGLGTGHYRRYERLHELADIESAINNLERTLQLTEDGNPDKSGVHFHLGCSQMGRHVHLGKLEDIDASILNLRKAVQLTDGSKPDYLHFLSVSLLKRYEAIGDVTDIDDALLNAKRTTQCTLEASDSDMSGYLAHLGACQLRRFECLGEQTDIENSILNLRKSVEHAGGEGPDELTSAGYLGVSQLIRYVHFGELTDLENSTLNLYKVVQGMDDGWKNKPLYISSFAHSQLKRYERFGDLTDLEVSIVNQRKAIQLSDAGHPLIFNCLSGLGFSLLRRYERLGEVKDVEDAVSTLQEAVHGMDDRYPYKIMTLCNLGLSQLRRYERLGELTDIHDSISNLQRTVQCTEDGRHQGRAGYLANLGVSQLTRYMGLGRLIDIEDSIVNLTEAIQLMEDSHSQKPLHLINLGVSLRRRFMQLNDQADLENSILYTQNAMSLIDKDHPDYAQVLIALGATQELRFERLGDPADLVASVATLRAAAQLKTAYPRFALMAARIWARLSHSNGDIPSALDGYRTALEILPKVAWLGLTITSHQYLLHEEGYEELSRLAATCAIQLCYLEEAVELLDLGRSVFWQQASSLRSNLEILRDVAPELASQVESVSQKLDKSNFSGSPLSAGDDYMTTNNTEDIGEERRRLVNEWERLLDRIRQFPQLTYFLKPIPFRQLRQSATGGQVVIINVSQYSVDALIFDATHHIDHIPLPNADLDTISELADDILFYRPIKATSIRRQTYIKRYLKPALQIIWNNVLIPVFHKIQVPLDANSDQLQRRIWWYPTGPLTFIPIHAAGHGNDVNHLVISSYVTTLASLYQSKIRHTVTGRQKLLTVSQPDTPGQEQLPLAKEEADLIVQAASLAGWSKNDIVRLDSVEATVDAVSGALDDECSWVHFACHGMQHPTSGMSSAFALYDGDLTLGQIASRRLSTGQFAFLSVCHAAAGLKGLPGEAMHLAGCLQFVGFPSVIATMWGISDKHAPIVAGHTYEYLFRNGVHNLDPSEAAAALNRAVLRLREDPNVTLDEWAPFIHFGI